MQLDDEACYRALLARDDRFDGLFFVGVTTTGIYCRPVCRARTPGRPRCVFYRHAAQAERDGFRACFRCRPELAPGHAPVDALPRLVARATARIDATLRDGLGLTELARALAVSPRHLRRAIAGELGVPPVALLQSRRMALAKQLVQDTTLPMAQVAFASGFSSVRRFNALFQARFGRPPTALRPGGQGGPCSAATEGTLRLRLDYRPPLDWDTLLAFLAARAIPGVEAIDGGVYRRTVRLGASSGWLRVGLPPSRAGQGARSAARLDDERNDEPNAFPRVGPKGSPPRAALQVEISASLAEVLPGVVAGLRALFDLDAQPAVIAAHLGADPHLGPLVRARPGLRVPGAFDGFETTVRALLGQQVSVRAATTLSGRLVTALGPPIVTPFADLTRLFPRPGDLAGVAPERITCCGLTGARARALLALSAASQAGLLLSRAAEVEPTVAALLELPGIGDWTAQYVAMRVLGWPDAYPAGDLALRKALGVSDPREAAALAEPWRPWRSYAALHLWVAYAKLSQGDRT